MRIWARVHYQTKVKGTEGNTQFYRTSCGKVKHVSGDGLNAVKSYANLGLLQHWSHMLPRVSLSSCSPSCDLPPSRPTGATLPRGDLPDAGRKGSNLQGQWYKHILRTISSLPDAFLVQIKPQSFSRMVSVINRNCHCTHSVPALPIQTSGWQSLWPARNPYDVPISL